MLGVRHQRGDVLVTSQRRLSGVNVTIGASHESGDRRRPKQLQLSDLLFLSERRRRHIREGLTLNGHVEFHNIYTSSSNILMSPNHVFISEKATNEQCDCHRFLAPTINTKTRLSEWEYQESNATIPTNQKRGTQLHATPNKFCNNSILFKQVSITFTTHISRACQEHKIIILA